MRKFKFTALLLHQGSRQSQASNSRTGGMARAIHPPERRGASLRACAGSL